MRHGAPTAPNGPTKPLVPLMAMAKIDSQQVTSSDAGTSVGAPRLGCLGLCPSARSTGNLALLVCQSNFESGIAQGCSLYAGGAELIEHVEAQP